MEKNLFAETLILGTFVALAMLQLNLPVLLDSWQAVLLSTVAVVVARAMVVYGLHSVIQRSTDRAPMSWLHVWNWGGLRGAIAMALVLSLPEGFSEHRELMKLMVLGIVLFSLLVQSATLLTLLHWLGLVPLHSNNWSNR